MQGRTRLLIVHASHIISTSLVNQYIKYFSSKLKIKAFLDFLCVIESERNYWVHYAALLFHRNNNGIYSYSLKDN